jgi:amino acid adenylation domain-containing protein
MIGHSVGEFVAAVLAGVMSLEDALPLVAMRGRLMQELPGGSMLAVRLPERDLVPLLSPELSIAAVNGPALSVASGPNAAIEALERVLEGRGAMSRRLHTSHAFHSSMVDPIIETLRARLEQVRLSPSSIPYVSCVTGTWIQDAEATAPHYWARHARETVRFADGITSVVTRFPGAALLEVGSGTVLSTLARQALQGKDVAIITSLQDSQLEASDRDCILEALGRLWTHGVEPDWSALRTQPARRVPLPTYPFERKRFWIDAPPAQRTAPARPEEGSIAAASLPSVASAPVALKNETEMNSQPSNSRIPELSAAIGAILEELSGTAPPSLTDPVSFLEMGYDSLFLTQLAQKIQSQMKVKITFRQLLGEYSTISLLAAHLADKMPAPAQRAVAAPAVSAGASSAASAAVTAALQGAVAAPLATAGGLEGLFRDLLQGAGASTGIPVAATPVAASHAATGLASPTAVAGSAPSAPDTSAAEQRPARFAVYNPKQTTPDRNITPEHQRHIDDLAARYSRRMAGSKRLTQQYRRPLADPRAASGFRNEWKEMVFPIVVERASGSKLWDVDGNELVDLVNGYGQTFFGHSPDFVVEAVKAQLDQGFAIGPQAELAGKVAELFSEMTGNERVTFCNTGSEAVMAAMRVARTVTGREKIVIFNGDYHGQFDEVLVKGVQRAGTSPRSMPVAPGIPAAAVQNMIVLDYATPATLQWVRENAEDLAAVVVEPVQSRHPSLQPYEFLREIRKITEESGTAFVMDEVVTGFRTHQGGIQALAGISADMPTYGTFVRHPLVLAAAWAVLQHLKAQGPQLQERLAQRTTALTSDLNQLFARYGIKARIGTFSSWFYFNIHDEHPLAALLFHHLRLRGVHIHDGFPCFLTTAHSDADIKRIYEAFSDSVEELHSVGILGNKPPSAAGGQGGALTGLPLTENQTEIWLAAQMGDQASCAFNESVSLRMRGALHETALRDALTFLFDRHDALRARFIPTGEEMRIAESGPVDLPVVDLAGGADAEKTLAKVIDQDARTPFDLINGPLARVQLLRIAPEEHVLLFTAHHIICDGWSINVIISELAEIYPLLCRGEQPQLAPALPFSSYARMQAQRDPEQARTTETFWLEQFRDPVKPLDLPTDRPRDVLKSYAGSSRCHRIEAVLYRALKQSGAKAGNTLFVTLLGAFQALIGRLCGQNEVVVGVPTAGQSLLEEQILVGHCVNFLPIRSAWSDATSIAEHLRTVAKRVLDSYEHQGYTLGTLVRKLDMARQQNRVPLAEIQFNLERLADRIKLPGLEIDVAPNAKAAVNFDLFLNVIESNDGLRLDCDYNTDLFDAATIDRWLDCYRTLLETLVADTSQPLVKAPYVPAAERQQLIVDFNRTAADFPSDRCVQHLFEMRAAEQPAAVAVQLLDATMSYDALNRRANQLANHLLRRLGNDLSRPRLVGVAVDRTFDMLVALLATMKAGCAYVPLDPAHPAARLRHILTDAAVTAVIVDGSADPQLAPAGTAVINLQSEAREIAGNAATAPAVPVSAQSAAYVIYTSGSTGQPKGVAVSHAAVVNFLTSMAREPGLTAQDVLLAVTTISFDIAGLELYLPLVTGARVVIAEREEVQDGFALLRRLNQCGATVMQATPAGWRVLLEAGFQSKPGFKMLCGGEALPRELANRLLEGGGVLWNMYGPTETTIWSSCCPVNPGDAPISVGKPIANTQLYVLDVNDQPVATGVPGQLHIGGDGVALGYHSRPELTAEKFVDNPFTRGRMYRTGDLARWLPDGRLQVLGRIDHQIKLRGYRIELGEVEAVLAEKAQLQAVAVVLREDLPGSPRLVAYYVPERASMQSSKDLIDLLAQNVPDYMIPSSWVRLDALPVSPNGKLDRAALPHPGAGQEVQEDYRAPTTPTELTLAGICMEVLQLTRISVEADLLRLGADSLQLFQITARANRTGLHFSVKQLLQQRTLAQVAHWLDSSGQDSRRPETGAELPSLGEFRRGRQARSKNT